MSPCGDLWRNSFLLAASAIILLTAGSGRGQWQYHATHDFIVAYTAPDSPSARETLRWFQLSYERLQPRLGNLQGPAVIFICADRSTFNRLSRGAAPDWGDGLADPRQRRILLLSPRTARVRRPFTHLVAHELVHLLMYDLAGGRPVPTWLAEGAAIYLAGDSEHGDPVLVSRAILTRSLIPFDEIDEVLQFEAARANLAYEQSYQAVRFLVQRHGAIAVRRLCAALATAAGPAAAFEACFGENLVDFEIAYFDWLRRNYRWQFLLDASMITWAMIIILFILAIVALRWRTRRKIAEWEKEEKMRDGLSG